MGNNGSCVMSTLPLVVGNIKRDSVSHRSMPITSGRGRTPAQYRSGSSFYRPAIFFAALGLPRPWFLKRIVAAVLARMLSSSGVLDSLGVIDSGPGFRPRLAISTQNFTNSGGGFFLRIA
jgi:hypothetical protein